MNKHYNYQIDEVNVNTNVLNSLFKAIETGNVEGVQTIVHGRPDLNLQNTAQGRSDSSWRRGDLSVFEHACTCCKNIRVFDILLNAMAPKENILNIKAKCSGETPLILAVKWNNSCLVIKYLLEQGADPRIMDADGWNALDYAYLSNYDINRLKIVDIITNSLNEWRKRESNAATKIQSLQRGRRDREKIKLMLRENNEL